MSTSSSRGGSFLRFRTGTTGASGRHVSYITRERAVVDREQAILLYQLTEHVRAAAEYEELRQTLIAYADTREEIEIAQDMARGKPRTHYRVVARFERDIPNEQALGMTKEWLDRELPRSRAFAVVHRDTEQTHVGYRPLWRLTTWVVSGTAFDFNEPGRDRRRIRHSAECATDLDPSVGVPADSEGRSKKGGLSP